MGANEVKRKKMRFNRMICGKMQQGRTVEGSDSSSSGVGANSSVVPSRRASETGRARARPVPSRGAPGPAPKTLRRRPAGSDQAAFIQTRSRDQGNERPTGKIVGRVDARSDER